MNELSKELTDAVQTIAEFCEFQMCHSCPFMRIQGCFLMKEIPNDWMDYVGSEVEEHE